MALKKLSLKIFLPTDQLPKVITLGLKAGIKTSTWRYQVPINFIIQGHIIHEQPLKKGTHMRQYTLVV